MKWLLMIFVSSALVASLSFAEEIDFPLDDLDFELGDLDDDEKLLREIEEKHVNNDLTRENQIARTLAESIAAEAVEASNIPNRLPVQVDPCAKIRCGAGRVCSSNDNKATCICIPDCPIENEPRRKVCTNKNETWPSDCEVHRQRCLCDTNDPACKGKEIKHIHINYYGECKDMPTCAEEEMNDFPRRMRDWLYNVMRDLAERHELNDHYMNMQLEAETNMTRRWANAAVWKWCDLDGHPHDRSVSRHELFPIRAPLLYLEHCIAPFLETCDPNGDHRITLQEWGKCLEIEESEMMDRCSEISKTPH